MTGPEVTRGEAVAMAEHPGWHDPEDDMAAVARTVVTLYDQRDEVTLERDAVIAAARALQACVDRFREGWVVGPWNDQDGAHAEWHHPPSAAAWHWRYEPMTEAEHAVMTDG